MYVAALYLLLRVSVIVTVILYRHQPMQNINCKSQCFVHGVVKGDVTSYEGKAGKSRCSAMPLSALRRNL